MSDDKTEDEQPKAKRQRTSAGKTRPNFFVAVQISNPGIHREVSILQNVITSKKPLFKSTLINLITLHITLCTLYLSRNGDIRRAKSALRKLETDMKDMLVKDPISLKFKGIGSFKNEVVFAKIEPGEPLTRMKCLHISLIEALKEEGLIVTDKFEPHLTIMKMSKDWTLRKQKIFKIPKDLYEEKNEMVFGDQAVRGVQLLRMAGRCKNTYYHCYHHFDFGTCSSELDDHEECCGVKSVFPSSLIELESETSDDESEVLSKAMNVKASEILEEILIMEAVEFENVKGYLKESEALVRKVIMGEEEGNSSVEVTGVRYRKAESVKINVGASRVQEESMNVESSVVQDEIKKIEESEVEDAEVIFEASLFQEENVNDGVSEVQFERVNIEELESKDENMNIRISTIRNENGSIEGSVEEENVIGEGLQARERPNGDTVVLKVQDRNVNADGLEDQGMKENFEVSEVQDGNINVEAPEAQDAKVDPEVPQVQQVEVSIKGSDAQDKKLVTEEGEMKVQKTDGK